MRGGEGVEFGIVELTTIVTLYGRKMQIKSRYGRKLEKRRARRRHQIFGGEEWSIKVSKIIKND
jgi:hypothetical protein